MASIVKVHFPAGYAPQLRAQLADGPLFFLFFFFFLVQFAPAGEADEIQSRKDGC